MCNCYGESQQMSHLGQHKIFGFTLYGLRCHPDGLGDTRLHSNIGTSNHLQCEKNVSNESHDTLAFSSFGYSVIKIFSERLPEIGVVVGALERPLTHVTRRDSVNVLFRGHSVGEASRHHQTGVSTFH